MTRLAVTITGDYVQWGLWESIRELIQNAKDAEDIGFPMHIKHNARSQKLRIWNEGVYINTDSLVLGGTTKRGDDRQRGQFGEGYKLAVASLVNQGHEVKIATGDYNWVPTLEEDPAYNYARILVINTHKKGFENSVCFEVGGVSKADWVSIKKRFLFFDNPESAVKNGTILREKNFANKLFVGGIFVAETPDNCCFGYNFNNLALDRDRKLADPWDLRREITICLNSAVKNEEISVDRIVEILEAEGGESRAIYDFKYYAVDICNMVAKEFEDKWGDNAVPVTSSGEMAEAEHHGFRGVFVGNSVKKLMGEVAKTFDARKNERALDRKHIYKLSELSPVETEHLEWACDLVTSVVDWFSVSNLSIVDFYSESILGVYRRQVGDVSIDLAKNILSDRQKVLKALVHEVAHTAGDDGSIYHRDMMDDIYSQIITSWGL